MNNSMEDLKQQENTRRIIFSIIAMLVITGIIITVLLFLSNFNITAPSSDNSSDKADSSSDSEDSSDLSNSTPDDESDFSNDTSSDVDSSGTPTDDSSDPDDETSVPTDKHGWVINNLGYTYLYYDRGLEQFTYSTAVGTSYFDAINKIKNKVDENINFYHMLVPTQVEFMKIPSATMQADNFYNKSQKSFINDAASKITDVKHINICEAFKLRFDENEYIYFRTDVNWTALGAYYAYCEFALTAGFDAVPLDVYNTKSYENFLGRFYTATSDIILEKNSDEILYYDIGEINKCSVTMYNAGAVYNNRKLTYSDVSDRSNGYNIFLGNQASRFKIETEIDNGKKILVIGDSSASPFVAFLTSHYEQVDLINPQYFKNNVEELISSEKYTDVLVMNYTTNATKTYYQEYFNNLNG